MVRILLDMDDVLCDFVGGACAAWGVTTRHILPYWPVGVWNMIPPLSHALGLPHPMKDYEFWGRLDRVPDFWRRLSVLPGAGPLLKAVKKIVGDDWYTVTAPSWNPDCIPDKTTWLADFMDCHASEARNRLVPTAHKWLLAKPGVLLIDDKEETVRKFHAEGGDAILYPRWWNSNYRHQDDPLAFVLDGLDKWRKVRCT